MHITPYCCKIERGGESMSKQYNVLKVIETMTRVKVISDSFRWPPLCTGILYQHKRTLQRKNKSVT